MDKTLLHHYKRFRAHQMATYGNSGLHFKGVDQRQYTGGGALYQCHAIAAYQSARRHIYFMANFPK
ncbi:MAG: hypothetical protein V3U84_02205 [Thiotrichaceae bacterium]